MKYITFLLMLFGTHCFAGEKFTIEMDNQSSYDLFFHDAKAKCVYKLTDSFDSKYLKKRMKKSYKLEVSNKFFSDCAWIHGTYSFDVDIVSIINEGGKVKEVNVPVFTVEGKSGAESSLSKIKNENYENLQKHHLRVELSPKGKKYLYTVTEIKLN